MSAWADVLVAGLWRAGWAVLPVAAFVACVCRFGKCSPSTRHALWLTTLACMIAAMWLPGPTVTAPPEPSPQDAVYFVGSQIPHPRQSPDGLFVPLVGGHRRLNRDAIGNKPAAPAQCAAETEPTPPRTAACGSDSSPAWLATTTNRLRRLSTPLFEQVERSTAWFQQQFQCTFSPEWDDPIAAAIETSVNCRDTVDCDSGAIPGERTSSDWIAAAASARNWLARLPRVAMIGMHDLHDRVAALADASAENGEPPIAMAWTMDGSVRTTADPNELDPRPGVSVASRAVPTDEWRRYVSGILGVRDAVGRVPPLPTAAWAFGFVAFAGMMVLRTMTAARRLGRARPADGETRRLVEREARRLGVSRPPETFLIADRVSPMIWCGRRVRLILPQTLWYRLDDDGRRAVICHELAHLRRRDHWVRWIEIVVGCLYWWHPVMWWVRSRLSEEADACCDEWVTWVLPRERRAYAEALLAATDFVSGSVGPQPLSMAVASARAAKIARRLTMIMTATRRPGLGLAGACGVLALGALAWVATPVQSCPPEERESTAPTVAPAERNSPFGVQTISAPEGGVGMQRRAPILAGRGAASANGVDWDDAMPASDPEMADRLRQIEESQKRLSEDLAKLSQALGRLSETTPTPTVVRSGSMRSTARSATPSAPAQRGAPAIAGGLAPRAVAGVAAPSPFADAVAVIPGSRPDFDQPIVNRVHKLSGDRLEALTELMLREDVPVCIIPTEGGIQVNGTEAQQAIFAAFVKMITANDAAAEIKLPDEKMAAVQKLAALESVPTRFVIGPDSISVQGTSAEQAVFDAFIELIHPRTPSGPRRGTTVPRVAPAIPAVPAVPAVPAAPPPPPAGGRGASGVHSHHSHGSASAAKVHDLLAESQRAAELERELVAEQARTSLLSAVQHPKAAKLRESLLQIERSASELGERTARERARATEHALAAREARTEQTAERLATEMKRRAELDRERASMQARLSRLSDQQKELELAADQLDADAEALDAQADGSSIADDSARLRGQARQIRVRAKQARRDAERIDVQIEPLVRAITEMELHLAAGGR